MNMPRVTRMQISGEYSYDNSDGERRVHTFDGEYAISTITHRDHFETVLFLETGIGPGQVALFCGSHPDPKDVEDMLINGNFRIPGDW